MVKLPLNKNPLDVTVPELATILPDAIVTVNGPVAVIGTPFSVDCIAVAGFEPAFPPANPKLERVKVNVD